MKDTWRIRIVSAEMPPRDVLESAQVIAGGRRQLEMLSDKLTAEKIPLGANALEQARMLIQRAEQEKVVILASGDPLYCGIGGTISKLVDAEHLDIDPGITAFQRLFARLGRPWENAALFSVHGSDSPLPWRRILNAGTSVIYGDSRRTASDLAAALITAFPGCATRYAAIGCELGCAREKIFSGTLAELAEKSAPALSLLVVFPEEGKRPGLPLGLPDSDYQHAANMITHPEVRAVVLSKLRAVSGVMWDLGAGSGSVGLEAAGLAPELTVYAVEKNPGRAADLRVNAQRHGIPLHVEEGEIASVAGSLPDPDRVFFGGGSTELETVFARLRPGGILVATAVLVETAVRLESVLTGFRTELLTLNVSRACKMSGGEFWKAENPITIAVFQK